MISFPLSFLSASCGQGVENVFPHDLLMAWLFQFTGQKKTFIHVSSHQDVCRSNCVVEFVWVSARGEMAPKRVFLSEETVVSKEEVSPLCQEIAAQLQCWKMGDWKHTHAFPCTHTNLPTCYSVTIDSSFDAWMCGDDGRGLGVGYRATWPMGSMGVRGTLILVTALHAEHCSLEGVPHPLRHPSSQHLSSRLFPLTPRLCPSSCADPWGQVNQLQSTGKHSWWNSTEQLNGI